MTDKDKQARKHYRAILWLLMTGLSLAVCSLLVLAWGLLLEKGLT